MALIIDIVDEVVEELNAGAFSLPFTATRGYLPRFELGDLETLRVTVVPKGLEIVRASRDARQHDYQLDVAVQKKLGATDAAEIDPLMDLVEEVADYFDGRALDTDPVARCLTVENVPIYAPEHMHEHRVFTSVLTLSFRTWR